MPDNVLIVATGDTGNEPESLRQSLERFGYFVAVRYIGRPRDFISVLSGEGCGFDFDYLVVSAHGGGDGFVMPELADFVYEADEPRGDFGADAVAEYLRLRDKTIVSLACATGNAEMCDVFSHNNVCIAPVDYVEGSSALFFAIRLFYELSANRRSLSDAFAAAKSTDGETALFTLAENQKN